MEGKFYHAKPGIRAWQIILLAAVLAAAVIAVLFVPNRSEDEVPEQVTAVATESETAAVQTEATTRETTEVTTEPAPVYTNPLTGEVVDAPVTGRIFSVSINNLADSLPHVGTNNADIYMEMFVNYSIIRGIALYTDPTDTPAIGSVRSQRVIFSQISRIFDTVMIHAGGHSSVLSDARERGVDSFNIDTADETDYSFRDMDRYHAGYGWEHTLFAKGDGIVQEAANRDIRIEQDAGKDYGLRFTEDAVPVNGETASMVNVTFSFNGSKKDTSMVYNADLGKYVYNQYGKEMVDGATDEPEAFTNVVILLADMKFVIHGYHQADFVAGGEGYFATGGKLIPILWHCETEEGPIRLTTLDGEDLQLAVGNSYFAIAAVDSPVSWE